MTDNEIEKAWGSCLKDNVDCAKCPLIHEDCHETILDLINRQKAEIERLKTNLNIELENYATEYDNKIKAEAYREFAERLKERTLDFAKIGINEHSYYLVGSQFYDNILKELVGEDDG